MPPSPYSIEIQSSHPALSVPDDAVRAAIHAVLSEEQISAAEIGVLLTDDAEIHRLNREHLSHDFPTDVITFPLSDPSDSEKLEGELVVSLDTAARVAAQHGWSLAAETLLYLVHGTLHLCGYDDLSDQARPIMRRREREILSRLTSWTGGIDPTSTGWDDGPA